MSLFPFPVLVGDIGGTNARFARVDAAHTPARTVARLKTGDYGNALDGLKAAIAVAGDPRPKSLILCGAGPRQGKVLQLTNASWRFDGEELIEALGLDQGMLVNDFEAQAFALPILPPGASRLVGPALPTGKGPLVAFGPGTGLGVAALLKSGDQFIPLASEAGHVEIGPADAQEERFWPHLERAHGRITAESVLSGPGLARLYHAGRAAAGHDPIDRDPAQIGDAALAGDAEAREAVHRFWMLLARFAGDMALTFLAKGGVYIMGGIGPKLAPLLDEGAFRQTFEAKAPVADVPKEIPSILVTETDAGLLGLAGLAGHPHLYLLDYDERLWR